MTKKKNINDSKKKEYQIPEESSMMANESMIEYETKSDIKLFEEDRLYSHEEVFDEFAKQLNKRIGTNISSR